MDAHLFRRDSRRIAVLTSSRAEYGLLRGVLRELQAAPDVELQLIVTGAHLVPESGFSISEIEADGFPIAERAEMLIAGDTAVGRAKSMGVACLGLADAFSRLRPDLLVLLGDRFELLAAAGIATVMNVPIGHIAGGDVTEGAIDDAVRHAVTKLSHLHFVATEDHAARVRAMGEEPWRVQVVGSPGLDNFNQLEPLGPDELARDLGFPLNRPMLLVTYHPATLELADTSAHVECLLGALADIPGTQLFTGPNSDTGHQAVWRQVSRYVAERPQTHLVANVGTRRYLSLLRHADAMVGNSSSGLIEAPFVGLPVVNVGERQAGRLRAANVIDVPHCTNAIREGIARALDREFRAGLGGLTSPYGDGRTAPRITRVLRETALGEALLRKRFRMEAVA